MIYSPTDLEHSIRPFFDQTWDPGYEEYRVHFEALKRIMLDCDTPLEGSIFTLDWPTPLPDRPVELFREKRRNFALFAIGGSSMLEIGFNSGFSCLLALTMNKELRYTGVDIGRHAYVAPCYEYLRSVFGERVRLHIGDSRTVLPVLGARGMVFELCHLDGGHGLDPAHADLCNILNFSTEELTLLVDDTGNNFIDAMCDIYVMQGRLARIEFKRLWSETGDQRMFRTRPPRRS